MIATIVLLYWQTRQTQQLHSANAVMSLRERFDSAELRAARKKTASFLLNDKSSDLPDLQVAAFFELMGAMVHRRVLDENLVWDAFGGWISNYLFMMRHPTDRLLAARKRMGDPLVFTEFEWIAGRIERMDRRRLGKAYAQLPDPEVEARTILAREASLQLFGLTTTPALTETS